MKWWAEPLALLLVVLFLWWLHPEACSIRITTTTDRECAGPTGDDGQW